MSQRSISKPIETIKKYFSSQGFKIGYPHTNFLLNGNSKDCLTVDINNQKYLVKVKNWRTRPVSLVPI